MKQKIIVLLGAPCSGKGTQGQFINQYMECISAGEILRKTYPKGTKEREELDAGKLIEVNKVNGIMLEYIKNNNFNVVLDGYPRSIDQAKFLLSVEEKYGVSVHAIVLNSNDSCVLVNRMEKRTYCESCGNTFDKLINCCNIVTVRRSDDNLKTFTQRLKVYDENIEDILKLFKNKYLLNAYDTVDNLAQQVKKIIYEIDH